MFALYGYLRASTACRLPVEDSNKAFILVRLCEILKLFEDSLVSIGNSNPCHRSCVASQEQERHVASCGHQVHQHGHPDGSQSGQAELLHQEATQEYAQTGTWDCCHPCKRKGQSARRVSQAFYFPAERFVLYHGETLQWPTAGIASTWGCPKTEERMQMAMLPCTEKLGSSSVSYPYGVRCWCCWDWLPLI